MTQKEIVEKCKEKGIDYTFYHIWRIGLKEGFFIKDAENNFDEVKFINFSFIGYALGLTSKNSA